MGVDSGLPDFRGSEGFWRAYPALAEAGLHFEEIACPDSFVADPELAWGFYGHRLALYRATTPHRGFDILRNIGDRLRHGAFVFTSNVDGHFQRAGFADEQVHECHGSIHHLQCLAPCSESIWPADFAPVVDELRCRLTSALPRCPSCGELARPNVLMFGDWHWHDSRSAEQETRRSAWRRRCRHPVVIEIGAGTAIPTVRRYGETQSASLIRINPREPQTPRHLRALGLPLGALAALEGINDALYTLGFWDAG